MFFFIKGIITISTRFVKGVSTINPGVLSNLILLLLFILILTDWFPDLYNAANKYIVISFLPLIYLASQINLPLGDGWKINLGGFILPLIIYIYLLKGMQGSRVYLITATTLLGTTYFLFKELIRLDPILLFWEELYELSIFLVVIVMIVVYKLEYRIALLIGGIQFGELLFSYSNKEFFTNITLGDGNLRDVLWFSIIEIMVLHFLFKWIKTWRNRKLTID